MQRKLIAWMGVAGVCAFANPAFATTAQYECADGSKLTATFSAPGVSPGSAVLTFAGLPAKIKLPQLLSADGGRYADSDIEFWIKGNSASLTRDGNSTNCDTK